MPSLREFMKKLPLDIIPRIFSYLPVHTILEISRDFSTSGIDRKILRECAKRLSTKEYFSRSFKDPTSLLLGMSKSLAVLSGSRACEYFVPGICTSESDWDFYVKDDSGYVGTFLAAGVKAGIEWISTSGMVERVLMGAHVKMVMQPEELLSMEVSDMKALEEKHGVRIDYTQAIEGGRSSSLLLSNEGGKVTMSWTRGEGYPGVLRILYGETVKKGRKEIVQLLCTSDTDPLLCEYLNDYHSSFIQSYISAHTACHLYGYLAKDMLSFKWKECGRDSVYKKYESRGVTYIDRPPRKGKKYREGTDEKTTSIVGFNEVGAPESIVDLYRRCAENIMWQEGDRSRVCLYHASHGPTYYLDPDIVSWVRSEVDNTTRASRYARLRSSGTVQEIMQRLSFLGLDT